MSEQIYITIAKTLSGEATDAEKKELQAWLAADEANAAEYEELTGVWRQTDEVLQQPAFNTSAAWERVAARTVDIPAQQEHLKKEPRQTKTIAFPSWAKLSLAAAAAVLIGLFVFKQVSGPDMIVAMAENGNKEVVLPDNSHITLREGSKLRYPEVFAANERHVELEGQAFFDVTRNEKQPFVIDAQSATVQVLGTSFDVKADEQMASVVVATGKVKMSMSKDASQALILTPGEKGSLKNGELKEELVSAGNYFFWRTGTIKFDGTPLLVALKQLSDLYNVEIRSNIPDVTGLDANGTYQSSDSVEKILSEICAYSGLRLMQEGDSFTINLK
ncbi:MAG: DUF4974 domain-containing protein [Sphingobacteriales bacterium]|nr:MAG: DUF4974 domain-containing protein [Sphingobacteriales bacterium]